MKNLIMIASIAALATACAQDAPRQVAKQRAHNNNTNEIVPARDLFRADSAINAVGGRIQGSIGNQTNLDASADSFSFYDDGMYSYGNVQTTRADGSFGLLILSVSSSNGIRALNVGETTTTCGGMGAFEGDVAEGEVVVAATGCTEQYDAPANCTEVSVDEPAVDAPEGSVATVNVLAHWDAGTDYNGNPVDARTAKGQFHLGEQ